MHSGSSNIKVPVDCEVAARGLATIGDAPAPKQRFVRVNRNLKPGDTLLNPGTNSLHRVLKVHKGVDITSKLGPLTVTWDELEAAVWKVEHEG